MIEHIRTLTFAAICYVWAILMPVHNVIYAILYLLGMNFLFGLTADIAKSARNREHRIVWSSKKALWAFILLFIMVVIICGFYIIGYFLNKPAEAITGVSWLCIAATYFFGCNIIRNILIILPKGHTAWKFFAFVYYVASLQMIERIPFLREYVEKGEKDEDK